MIYFDNAATSWPKPDAVPAAMARFLREQGANPGRSGHRLSIEAARVVYETRERVARLLGFADTLAVVFTKNATEAMNLALLGLLASGDHVITSVMEHNSVLRPLRFLEGRGVIGLLGQVEQSLGILGLGHQSLHRLDQPFEGLEFADHLPSPLRNVPETGLGHGLIQFSESFQLGRQVKGSPVS